jgi:vacuolar-type H+-ATPase subunit I/STV1
MDELVMNNDLVQLFKEYAELNSERYAIWLIPKFRDKIEKYDEYRIIDQHITSNLEAIKYELNILNQEKKNKETLKIQKQGDLEKINDSSKIEKLNSEIEKLNSEIKELAKKIRQLRKEKTKFSSGKYFNKKGLPLEYEKYKELSKKENNILNLIESKKEFLISQIKENNDFHVCSVEKLSLANKYTLSVLAGNINSSLKIETKKYTPSDEHIASLSLDRFEALRGNYDFGEFFEKKTTPKLRSKLNDSSKAKENSKRQIRKGI